jgi:hypothetical protein
MPDPVRRSLLLLPALPLLAWPGPAHADDLLAQLMARLAAVPERRAAFRERRTFAALDAPLESTGHLLYRRPAYLEKITDWPQPERLVVDGDRLVLTAGAEAPRVVDLGSQPELRTLVDSMRAPLAGDLPALQRRFTLRSGGSLPAWTLEMTPLDARAARMMRSIRLAGATDEIRDIVLTQANGDEQWMRIGAG